MAFESLDPVRFTEHLHGHLGWLAAAALVHPAIVLRKAKRRAHVAVGASTALVTVAAGIGAWLYVAYRAKLKQGIFIDAPRLGLLFERKEHLAFGAVVLAWAGAAAYFGAHRASPATSALLHTAAFRSFVASAVLAIVACGMGTVVAVYRSF